MFSINGPLKQTKKEKKTYKKSNKKNVYQKGVPKKDGKILHFVPLTLDQHPQPQPTPTNCSEHLINAQPNPK